MIRTSHRSPKTACIGLSQDFLANLAENPSNRDLNEFNKTSLITLRE